MTSYAKGPKASSQDGPELLAEWFWTDRWIRSSAASLPLESRGLFREMLTQAWALGGYITSDLERVRLTCRVKESEWNRAWPDIAGYWNLTDDGKYLYNRFQLSVYEEARGRHEAKARAGRARWEGTTPEERSEHGRRAVAARKDRLPTSTATSRATSRLPAELQAPYKPPSPSPSQTPDTPPRPVPASPPQDATPQGVGVCSPLGEKSPPTRDPDPNGEVTASRKLEGKPWNRLVEVDPMGRLRLVSVEQLRDSPKP